MIELLIVVAIILIIAAIAIPNLLRARIAANESSAAASVRSVATAEVTYNAAYPTVGYALALANLGGLRYRMHSEFGHGVPHRPVLSTGVKSGYTFTATGFPSGASAMNVSFVVGSAPSAFNQTGVRNFCIITDGSSAQQSRRVGRVAGPGCRDLRGLRGRSIDQHFQPGPGVRPLRRRDQSPSPLLS